MTRRWRPSLAFVLGGALAGMLAMSFAGLVALRYLGPAIGFKAAAVLLALGITAATVVLGWLLLRLLLGPIRTLEAFARAQELGHPAPPPVHFGTRETAATARRVIAMAETLRDREATIRSFTDHVTHELKTPVSAIRAAAELLQDSEDLRDGDRRLVREIDGARAQLESQLNALRQAAQAREARYLGQCNLAELLPILEASFPDLCLTTSGDSVSLPIAKDGMLIVLRHLLQNAKEHAATKISHSARTESAFIMLDITDNGDGISPGNEARIFTPFFTTRRDTGGTGMGLSVARNLLAAHGAQITLESPKAAGTCFRILFDHKNQA